MARYVTREKRAIERHDEASRNWEKEIETVTKKIKRKYEDSIMNKITEFRRKKETENVLELLKSQKEKYGKFIRHEFISN